MDRQTARFDRFRRDADTGALGELFDDLAPRLLRLALHWTGDPARAEDAVQETFLVAIERREAFDAERSIEAWLTGICLRVARRGAGLRPTRAKAGLGELIPEVLDEVDPSELVAARDAIEEVERAIEELPETYRAALRLRLIDGLSTAEVAIALGLPAGTARSHVSRGLERLRQRLPTALGAGLAAFVTTERGLAAVRGQVLSAAHSAVATTGVLLATSVQGSGLWIAVGLPLLGLTLLMLAQWLPGRDGEVRTELDGVRTSSVRTLEMERVGDSSDAQLVTREPVAATGAGVGSVTDARESAGTNWTVRVELDEGPLELAEGVHFHADETGAWRSERIRFDATGTWHGVDLEPGRHRVDVGLGGVNILLREQQQRESTVWLRKTLTLELEVVDSGGRPAPGALFSTWVPESGDRMELGRTDAEGRFRVTGLLPGALVEVRREDLGASAFNLPFRRRGTIEERVVLDGGLRTLRGQVVDRDGEPASGVEVFLGSGRHSEVANWKRWRTLTDDEGFFEFAGDLRFKQRIVPRFLSEVRRRQLARSPDEVLWVEAAIPGVAYGRVDLPATRAEDLPPLTEVALTLRAGGTVRGRVLDGSGEPLADYRISDGLATTFVRTTSDEDGNFELAGLPTGVMLELVAERPDRHSLVAPLTHRFRDGEVVDWEPCLRLGTAVDVRVLDHEGRPARGLDVVLRNNERQNSEEIARWRTTGGGRVRAAVPESFERSHFFVLHQGSVEDLFEGPFSVDTVGGGEVELTIRMSDPRAIGASVTATLVDTSGRPTNESVLMLVRLIDSKRWVEHELVPGEDDGLVEGTALTSGYWAAGLFIPEKGLVPLGHRELAPGEQWSLGLVALGSERTEVTQRGDAIDALLDYGRAAFATELAQIRPGR